MKSALIPMIGALVLACSGCGGGGGDSASAQSAAPAAPKTVLVEAYGDSTTVGVEIPPSGGFITKNSVPALLQSALQAKFGTTVTMSNQGVSSTEASQLLNGTDGVHPSWNTQMAASKAQIVTINMTLNSPYFAATQTPGVTVESPSTYADVMTQLVSIAKQAGKQVILLEPNPTCEPIRQPVLGQYVTALRQVAQQQGVPIVGEYDVMMAMPNWQGLLSDCLHPTDDGYQIKAGLEFPVLSDAVSKLMTSR
ncbi:SGNH/GDSL hydrolase family protein [Burkholderia sp. B21-005]|uniref:SGNH/GDSL hydrolase family protein n=1 Tax=Burkholderia sp. B21-005 TaxID=2890406 RepID=UPI001E616424|nr:SGNH/GDSL hydrolase family protein [Burkholderia sp. B21-005]UEP42770.1 SGNH/GDSL hydrolase family protein [Burkholderia sp. B21-005]